MEQPNIHTEKDKEERLRGLEEEVRMLAAGVGAAAGGAGKIFIAKVEAHYDNYIQCVFYDPVEETDGADVNVLKPLALQRRTYDGKTLNGFSYTHYSTQTGGSMERDCDIGGGAIHRQELFEEYYDGAVIYIMNMGRTQYVLADEDAPAGPQVGCQYVDMNIDNRSWGV